MIVIKINELNGMTIMDLLMHQILIVIPHTLTKTIQTIIKTI